MKTISSMKRIKILLLTAIIGSAFTACNMQPPGEATEEAVVVEKNVQPVKVRALVYTETSVEQNITATINACEG